ncbi:MAG: hypothetical protein U1D67_05860, partial [Dehalococcoidia bacterium]|nr:hypothetical protein [Dehalococcoidia bacterium]
MSVYNYPAPRYPDYKEPTSVEECLTAARGLVVKLTEGEQRPEVGRVPRFYTREGSNFLIATPSRVNKYVAEAVTQALKEKGAGKIDFVCASDLGLPEPKDKDKEESVGFQGWKEAEEMYQRPAVAPAGDKSGLVEVVVKYLDEHPEYSFLIGARGGAHGDGLGKHAHKWNSPWQWINTEHFLTQTHYLPLEVHFEVEKRVLRSFEDASEVRITDPEGTHLEFSVTEEQAKNWAKWGYTHGILYMDPLSASAHPVRSSRRRKEPDFLRPIIFPKANGVLAG